MEKQISIIMTSYNYADYIKEAIESVIAQTYTNWELIIVDDGSTDNSVDVINGYIKLDSRIKLFQHEGACNKGLADSLKLGVEKAQNDWITFLESDDKFAQNALEEKIKAIQENPEIELIFSDLEMFQDEEKIAEFQNYFRDVETMFFKKDSSKFIQDFKKLIPKLNIIPTFSVVMLKKELLKNCDFYPPCKASVDYYLWAQLCNAKIYYLNKKLTYWRIHSGSYINIDKHSWFTRFVFFTKIYYFTIAEKPLILKVLLMLNYLRTRIIYLKLNKKTIKLNLFNNKYIFEKDLS